MKLFACHKLVILAMAALCLSMAFGQSAAPSRQHAVSTAELRLQLARDELRIAQMQQQIDQLQMENTLYAKFLGIPEQQTRDKQAIDSAMERLRQAQKITVSSVSNSRRNRK